MVGERLKGALTQRRYRLTARRWLINFGLGWSKSHSFLTGQTPVLRYNRQLLQAILRRQISKLLEIAIARLPDTFRPVFVLREIEGLSVEETAEALQIPAQTVKTRLLRARRRLQKELDPELCGALSETFVFAGADCETLTDRVVALFLSETAPDTK